MPTILTRPSTYTTWNPAELAGPYDGLTLREWEVSVVTCALAEPERAVLLEALLEEATGACERRQQWPLPRIIAPYDPWLLGSASTDTLRDHLAENAASVWQILDLAPGVIPGMLRALLLVILGARLRQTLTALEGRAEAEPPQRELAKALKTLGVQIEPAPAAPAPVSQPPRRRRWWRRVA